MKTTIAILFCSFCLLLTARADVTATVYPGYTFTDADESDGITIEKLNLAARPTVEITGTLGGTNVSLGAGSVNGTVLADTVVDDVTLEFNDGVAPRHIRVKAEGIATSLLTNSAVNLSKTKTNLLVDGVFADIATNDVLAFGDVSAGTNTRVATLEQVLTNAAVLELVSRMLTNTYSFTNFMNAGQFATAEYALATGLMINTNHPWSNSTPSMVRAVLVCKTADRDYAVGDELDVQNAGYGGAQATSYGANKTNVWLSLATTTPFVTLKNDGDVSSSYTITAARWRIKLYAAP